MGKESLDVLSRISGIPIQTKEIISSWLLLTYDIPKSKEGDKARRRFLEVAKSIGATQHTASVYYMPWTSEAESLALDLARVGKAYVWTSTPTDTQESKKLTENYDEGLETLLDEVSYKLDKIQAQFESRHYKRAEKMADRIRIKLNSLMDAVSRRGSPELYLYAKLLERRLSQYG